MAIFFKDRIPDPIHGENARYYDAVANDDTVKLSDFKLVLKNNIPSDKLGDPVNAGNLNYASGNVIFPAPSSTETHTGDILSIMSDGVIPAKTKRATAALGNAYSTAQFRCFHKLSDTKQLIAYNDRLVVATVDFNGKTVSFGTERTGSNLTDNSHRMLLLRNYDENPTAIFVLVYMNSSGGTRTATYTITGDVISAETTGYSFLNTHTQCRNRSS